MSAKKKNAPVVHKSHERRRKALFASEVNKFYHDLGIVKNTLLRQDKFNLDDGFKLYDNVEFSVGPSSEV